MTLIGARKAGCKATCSMPKKYTFRAPCSYTWHCLLQKMMQICMPVLTSSAGGALVEQLTCTHAFKAPAICSASQAGSRTCSPRPGAKIAVSRPLPQCASANSASGHSLYRNIVRTDEDMLSGAYGRLSSSAEKASPRRPSALLWAREARIVRVVSSSCRKACRQ